MNVEDEQNDIDDAAEHQQQLDLEHRLLHEGDPDLFFIRHHDETVARRRAEQAQLKMLKWALDRMFIQ